MAKKLREADETERANQTAEAAQEPVAPPKRVIKTTEYLRYDFTPQELQIKARDLALTIQHQRRAQEDMKAAQQQFKQQIEFDQAKISGLSNNVSMGWEMRNIPCEVHYNTPNAGFKRVIRTDTGEVVTEVSMTGQELQEKLFEDPPAVEQQPEATEAAVAAFFGQKPEAAETTATA